MHHPSVSKKRNPLFWFRALSLQHRLPLLICLLLVSTVLALGFLSELGVKKAAMAMGKERLGNLTNQLSTMYGQSAVAITTATRANAAQEAFKKNMETPARGTDTEIVRMLDKMRPDSTWVLTELVDKNFRPVVRSGPAAKTMELDLKQALDGISIAPDSCVVGKFIELKGILYYPIVAAVTDQKNIKGYLVRWRLQTASPAALVQLSQLLGSNATLYVGNWDGTLWTDMRDKVPPPPVNPQQDHFLQYTRPQKDLVIASATPIPHTPWIILIEFSQGIMMESARRFLPWIVGTGIVLVIIGIITAWLTSRNITRPLNKLRQAANGMAAGEHSEPVEEDPGLELRELSRAFNAMMARVDTAQNILEKAVEERTAQLHEANKELEAFSYSVSHDLRTPLRAVNGYTRILKEEYNPVLGDEGNRIADKIVDSAERMSQLIDDLITFSRISKIAVQWQPVPMEKLAQSCLKELLQETAPGKYQATIHPMPDCMGDPALIRQVWINLISNAIKYSAKKEKPLIEIGWQDETQPAAYFVRDNGAGFDMKYADKLFGVFQRLHPETEFTGSGIGLSLVKRIVQRHNGTIRAQAAIGQGAVFYFTIQTQAGGSSTPA
jgi:signal transduction histidine kinase